uniref:Tuberoinfundibular peptide of 39 residues n=1 Tax=Salmo trutta TaxID=8032 RepID=A0A674A229_SALTR
MAGLVPPAASRPALLLMTLMAITLVTSSYPQPRNPGDKREDWEVLWPTILLRDWSMQMMSAPDFGVAKSKAELLGEQWLPMVDQSQMDEDMAKGWLGDWDLQGSNNEDKRNIMVADDAVFREKSKLLTKLLVVNSQ